MEDQQDKLDPRKRRAIERFFEEKDKRHTPPAAPPSAKGSDRSRRSRWDDDDNDDQPDWFEKIERRPTAPPVAKRSAELPVATVLQARGSDYIVAIDGESRVAKLASRLVLSRLPSPIVVGDKVRITTLGNHLRIDAVDPRRSVLGRFVDQGSRRTTFDPVAANVDVVLMVCTPESPPFRPGLIDRYLTAAALEGLPLAICLNKADLGVSADVEVMLTGYESLGIDVFRISEDNGVGIGLLKESLKGKITLFTGHSGVGKSTILNAVEPGLSLRTGEVTQAVAGLGKGTHTTSSARLIPLSLPDAYVVDSPGIREFGLGQITPDDLIAGFPEIEEWAQQCSMRHCRHRGEAGCAVEVELSKTPFGQHRLASYRSLAE